MDEVTDAAFRHIIAKYGKPDVIFTEFVSCDGLCSIGKDKLMIDLKYSENEKPIVAQIFGANPETFRKTAELIQKLGFDGIDINMGCPKKNVVKNGAGAGLIKTPSLAKEIILATKEGAPQIPISVKTRIGFNSDITEEWIGHLLETNPAAIIIHGRTRKQMSKVPNNWNSISKAVKVRNNKNSSTLIIGNGGILSLKEAELKAKETGVNGIMIGKGVFGNPWVFNRKIQKSDLSLSEIFKVLLEHSELFENYFKGIKNFSIMRKHFKSYIAGHPNTKELKIKLLQTNNHKEVKDIIEKYKCYNSL